MGVLATLVDMVAGSPAHAVINPTVDLRVSLLDRAPSSGMIELVCYPVKVGQRLFVGETLLHTGDVSRPFARSLCTFINTPLPEVDRSDRKQLAARRARVADSYDESLQLREPVPGTFEMDAHEAVRNGADGTIQGGAQALMAELAGERALAARRRVRGGRPRDPLPQPGAHRAGARHRRGDPRRARRHATCACRSSSRRPTAGSCR